MNEFTKTKSRRAMFGRIDKALKDSIDVNGTNYDGIQNIAFMNAFQKPAAGNGKNIKVFDIDIEQSAKVINQVLSIIKPKHLCFVSKKAYKKIIKRNHIRQHPCRRPSLQCLVVQKNQKRHQRQRGIHQTACKKGKLLTFTWESLVCLRKM